jgi:hypothetical protein
LGIYFKQAKTYFLTRQQNIQKTISANTESTGFNFVGLLKYYIGFKVQCGSGVLGKCGSRSGSSSGSGSRIFMTIFLNFTDEKNPIF